MPETDASLATLDKKVDVGFARIDGQFAVVDEHFKRVDDRFDEVDRRFDAVERRADDRTAESNRRFDETLAAMRAGFAQAETRSARIEVEMKEGFDRIDAKFDAKFDNLYGLIIKVGGGLIGALVASIFAIVISQL